MDIGAYLYVFRKRMSEVYIYCANKLVCTVLTYLQTRFLLTIDIHVRYTMMHVRNNLFNKKIVLVIAI